MSSCGGRCAWQSAGGLGCRGAKLRDLDHCIHTHLSSSLWGSRSSCSCSDMTRPRLALVGCSACGIASYPGGFQMLEDACKTRAIGKRSHRQDFVERPIDSESFGRDHCPMADQSLCGGCACLSACLVHGSTSTLQRLHAYIQTASATAEDLDNTRRS